MADRVTEKLAAALAKLAQDAATAIEVNPGGALHALDDARKNLRRIAKRAAVEEGWEAVELVQDRGPTLAFTGRLLGETGFTLGGDEPIKVGFELWESRGGALIAATHQAQVDHPDEQRCEAAVIEPSEDAQAMRFAGMEAFGWERSARAMVRKLGWSLKRDVE